MAPRPFMRMTAPVSPTRRASTAKSPWPGTTVPSGWRFRWSMDRIPPRLRAQSRSGLRRRVQRATPCSMATNRQFNSDGNLNRKATKEEAMSLRKLLVVVAAASSLLAGEAIAQKVITLWHPYNAETDMIHYGIKTFNESQKDYRIE